MAKQKKPAAEEVLSKTKKKDGENAPSRTDRIDSMIADIQKKMRGRASLMPASEYSLPYLTKRLPTGLLTLDLELKGGWASGGVNQLIGRKNAGKTALMWMTIRQLQFFLGKKMKVLMAMTEIPADRGQGRMLGARVSMGDDTIKQMNNARVENGWPEFTKEEIADLKDEVGTIHELHAMAVEDFYDIILRAVEENMYHFIVIDSIGNALSAAEQENESVHDKVYGGIAAPNTTFLKKLTNLLTMKTPWGETRDTCVLGINQVRDDVKNPNKPYKAPGGNSLEHAKLIDVYVESGKFLGEEVPVRTPEGMKNQWRAHGKEVNWRIEKGKAGMHEGARGTYVYDFRINNVDYYTDTLIAGVMNGVIESSGAWLGIPDPNKKGEYLMRAQGQPKFLEYLALDAQQKAGTEELSFMNYIRDQCFKKNNINISYDWE